MASQFSAQNIQTKVSLLIFVKGSVAPVVLYLDNPEAVYNDIQNILKAQSTPKMIELEGKGPIKKVSLVSSEISGLAIQEEQYVVKQ